MTERKHLKRRVRARMEQTDESYVTARRQVVAARTPDEGSGTGPVRPDGMLVSWPACGGVGEHDSGLAAHLLASSGTVAPHTGEPYSQPMMVGLAGGIGFMYAVFSYAGGNASKGAGTGVTTMTVVARHHPEPYLPAAIRRAGASLVEQHGSSPGPAEKRLRKLLETGNGAVCAVARGRLPWHSDPASAYANDPYHVGVCGLTDAGEVLVDDGADTPYALGVGEFTDAWAAHRKGRFALFSVPEPAPVRSVGELAAAVRDAVATTCAHFTGPVLGHSFDVNFGFSGMGRLADQLADPDGKNGWTKRFVEPGTLFWAVYRLRNCLQVEYTGPDGTRPEWADFLDEAASVLAATGGGPSDVSADADRWRQAAVEIRAAGELWSGLVADALAAHPAFEAIGSSARAARAGEDATELAVRLAAAYAEDPLPAASTRELLDRLAERVRGARGREQRAVELLS